MSTTNNEISRWFDEGVKKGKKYLIVVCDAFDHEDYPVFTDDKDFSDKYEHYKKANMQRIMEVYNLNEDKDVQLNEPRAFNFPPSFPREAI